MSREASSPPQGTSSHGECCSPETPVVLLVIGMAGSGKTTLMGRIQTTLREKGSNGYLINLDPAVMSIPYEPHVDIRDTVRMHSLTFFSYMIDRSISRGVLLAGKLQECDEAIQCGTKRRHPDVLESVCHKV